MKKINSVEVEWQSDNNLRAIGETDSAASYAYVRPNGAGAWEWASMSAGVRMGECGTEASARKVAEKSLGVCEVRRLVPASGEDAL